MARNSRHRRKSKSTPRSSGAIGGPGTGHGLKYQVNYSQFKVLDFISRALSAPHRPWAIRIEPRAISETTTRWDLGSEPPEKFAEVKLNPKRQEILEWLDHVREAAVAWPERAFRFVYSEGGGRLLATLHVLVRLAIEARDKGEFDTLVAEERPRDSEEILDHLGSNSYGLLRRMKIKNIPENVLENNLSMRARLLAGDKGGRRLIELLFTKLHNAIPNRATFLVSDIVAEATTEGINLQPPPDVDPRDLSPLAACAIVALQSCRVALPKEVLAAVLGCSLIDLERELSALAPNAIHLDEKVVSIGPLPSRITSPDGSDVAAKTLEALLTFIEGHKNDPTIMDQIHNAIALAQKCILNHPRSVAMMFPILDKLLKRLGNKHVVLRVANLSVNAVHRTPTPRDLSILEAEARSLICGVSWAYQRLGRLDKARVAAEDSRRLAQMAGLSVTLAFCVKCIGRLCRMEGESLPSGREREARLNESVAMLEDAIDRFSQLPQFGISHSEVGDTYSLLGRTYLESGHANKADQAIRKAYELLIDRSGKDYLDLVILSGDLEVAYGNRVEASRYYDQALSLAQASDPEISEMRARAYFKRGKNRAARGDRPGAVRDLSKAADIWERLSEVESTAEAKWEAICLTVDLPRATLQILEKESAPVRVIAMDLHNQRLAPYKGKRIAQRGSFNLDYWKQRIREASEQVAANLVEW